ncbi:MAG: hypothetical protein M1438_09235, partial [Deltaproteobacteria bacterium]|nr:hypothetical protein [Deltaproteobacteria bacterium]
PDLQALPDEAFPGFAHHQDIHIQHLFDLDFTRFAFTFISETLPASTLRIYRSGGGKIIVGEGINLCQEPSP